MMHAHFAARPSDKPIEQGLFARCFDFSASAVGLTLLLPVLLAVALAIKLSDGGPVFYRQRRVGRGFQPFFVYKFRSMIPEAERLGAGITTGQDPRVTRLGRFLRRHKLDELPQLWNVIRGEMALVGPRPEVPKYVESFRPQYIPLLRLRPGLTDPGTLAFSDEENLLSGAHALDFYAAEIVPRKLSLSLEYAQRRTWTTDLGVLFLTLRKLFLSSTAKTTEFGRAHPAPEAVTPLRRSLP